jgi:phenylacetate-CoA ligase
MQSQWRSRDEIEAVRVGDLRRLLRHAYDHTPLYGERMRAVGAEPEDIRSVADLARLPLLTREQAIDLREQRKSTAPPFADIQKSTGGTTGQPLKFGYDWSSEYWRQAVKLRGWSWGGYRPGMRTFYFWGTAATPPLAKRLWVGLDRQLRRERYVDCTRRSDGDLDQAVELIRRERPEMIICFSQAGADLARHVSARGLRTWDTIPVLCCAERVTPLDRAALEEAFGPAVFETYGCREVMLIASECPQHNGMHVSAENLIVEVVVRQDGGTRAARPGEVGEVVLTDLHNYGMPFIRYANGDLALATEERTCPCGRALPILQSVEGRVADTMRDGTGARISGLMFNVIFTPLAADVRQFQAVQHRDGAVTLKLVTNRQLDAARLEEIRARCAEKLTGVPVRAEIVDQIPPGKNGKRRVVIVEN